MTKLQCRKEKQSKGEKVVAREKDQSINEFQWQSLSAIIQYT